MKRIIDIFFSALGLSISLPIILPVLFLIWRQDKHSPFYIAPRVGKGGNEFRMVKLRTMIINADKSGVDSTSTNDQRITNVGKFIRKYKLDELSQLWNVLIGDMSLVGPRPNVKRETDLYTREEKTLLSVKPGITDFSSIIFSDEGDILKKYNDPDLAYNQVIRPWKSKLGLLYIQNQNLLTDFLIIALTGLSIFSRESALKFVHQAVSKLTTDTTLLKVISRRDPPHAAPPPGATEIVTSRMVAN